MNQKLTKLFSYLKKIPPLLIGISTIVACIAALVVVPEVRGWLNLDSTITPQSTNIFLTPQVIPTITSSTQNQLITSTFSPNVDKIFACWTAGAIDPDGVKYMNIVNKDGNTKIFMQTSCNSGAITERFDGQFENDGDLVFQRNNKEWVVRIHPNGNGTLQALIDDEDHVFHDPRR